MSVTFQDVLALQPLPHLAWPRATGYSEFPSLGLARFASDLAEFHIAVRAAHPRSAEDLKESLFTEPDIVVIGDFRYYAYFANPRFQVEAALDALRAVGWEGDVIVAGRHADFMPFLATDRTRVATSYAELVTLLTGLPTTEHHLGADADALPGPGIPNMAILEDGADLPGSFSRPGHRMAQLVLSKGCPFTCAFCEKAELALSTMSPRELKASLDRFAAAGTERIIFWDEVFAWPHQEHGDQIKLLSESGIGFNCNARLDSLRPEFVEALASAGCREVLFGLEVIAEVEPEGSAFLNLDVGKQRDLAFVEDRIELLRSYGIAGVGSLIVGLPSDDEESVARRIEIADSLDLSHCYVRPLVPFPESAVYRELSRIGVVNEFEAWHADEFASFPHGYPTLSSIPRSVLAAYCGR